MTVLEILKKTETYFQDKSIDNPRLQAELLLCHLLDCGRLDLYLNFDKPLVAFEVDRFREMIRRRAAREPLQYITGQGPFRDFTVQVASGVLIPRPETEILIEVLFRDLPDLSDKRILDVGTGSGILALAVKRRFPQSRVVACDVSPVALEIARENGRKLDLDVQWILSDAFTEVGSESFDVILSNPPYIPSRDIELLEPEVKDHEPRRALDGGPDGLAFYRRLLSEVKSHLTLSGRLYLEVGDGQAADVRAIGEAAGLSWVANEKDLTGKDRIVVLSI